MRIVFLSFSIIFLSACGGGGGGGSSAPLTTPDPASPGSTLADEVALVEDNVTEIDVLANDSNVVASTLSISGAPANGGASVSNGRIIYTPDSDFVGPDSLDYAVDGDDGVTVSGSVSITVQAVTITQLEVLTLSVPTTGYASVNDVEIGTTVLASSSQTFEVPPNAISVVVSLSGEDVNIDGGGLFIREITSPSGVFPAFQRSVNFCFDGSCSALVPRLPGYVAQSGTWTIQLGTTASSLENIDTTDMSLVVATRTGPDVDLEAAIPASIVIKPFLTATSVIESNVQDVLTRVANLADANGFEFVIDPVETVNEFAEVSSSFLDSETQTLVRQGAAAAVNVFFIESFNDGAGLGGVTGSIPATSGSQNGNNGALINAGTLIADASEFSLQETAELTFHEIGHLLGLYHTTESQFTFNDVLDDTPNCERSVHDLNDDGLAASTECPDAQNPMFWQNSVLTEWEPLTDDQKWVIYHSPLAAPGGQ